MKLQDLAIWGLVFAFVIHTIAEAWLPEYEKRKPDWRSVLGNRLIFLDNLPIFIALLLVGVSGWRFPIVAGILPAVGLTHPLFDHVGLSWKWQKLRPGTWTAIFLVLPFSVWIYVFSYTDRLLKIHELLISATIGLAISIWLLWAVLQESHHAQS